MQPDSPVLPGYDFQEVRIAEHQTEYMTLPSVVVDNGQALLSRWHLNDDDRRRIAEGQDIYVFIGVDTREEKIQIRPINLEVITARELVERGEQSLTPTTVADTLA